MVLEGGGMCEAAGLVGVGLARMITRAQDAWLAPVIPKLVI